MLGLVLALSLAVRGQPYINHPEPGIKVRTSRADRFKAMNGGAVDSPLLFSTTGALASPTSMTNPVTNGMTAWCVTQKITPGTDWAVPAGNTSGLFGMVAFNSAFGSSPGIYFYRQSDASTAIWWLKVYSNTGASIDLTGNAGTNKFFRNQYHLVTVCKAPEGYTVRLDGNLVSGPSSPSGAFTMPTNLHLGRIATIAGASQNPISVGTVGDYCISGPKAVIGTTAQQSVNALCGEFTNTTAATLPCWGCVTPLGGATKAVALGDSITASGVGSARPYPAKLNALLGTSWNIANAGAGGARLASMRGTYQATYKGKGYTHVALLGGINNIILDNESGATAFTAWQTLANEIRADGSTLVAVLLTPFKGSFFWDATRQTAVDDLNALILNYCSTNSVTCVDTYSAMEDPGNPDRMLSAYFGDGLHPSQAGLDKIADLVRAAFP